MRDSDVDSWGWLIIALIISFVTIYLYPDESHIGIIAFFVFMGTYLGGNIWATLKRIEDGQNKNV